MSSFSVAQWAQMTELWLKAKQDMEEATGRSEIMHATSSCPSMMAVAGSFPPHNFLLSDEEEGASSSPYSSCTSSFSAAFYNDDEDCDADWVLRLSNQLPEEDYAFGSSSCPSPMVTMAADLLLPPPPPNLPPQSISAYQPQDQTPSNNNEETLLHIQRCNGFQDIEVVMTPTHRVEGKEEEEKGKEEDEEEEEEEEEVAEKKGKHGIEEEEKKKSDEVARTEETEPYNRKPNSGSMTMDNASLSWRDAVMTLQATKAEGGVRGAKWWWYLQGQMDQVMPSSSATSSASSSCSSAPTTPSTAKRAAAGGKTGATSRVGRRSGAPIASAEGTTVAPTTRKRPVTPPPTRKLPPRSKLRGVIEWLQQEQQQQVQADVTKITSSRRVG
ncbi:cell division cycle and apoptosis regulator protein 1 [Balamuthia mandrillaris]